MTSIFEPGKMLIGCNYWASHAGIDMWRDWRPEVIAADFDALARHGFRVLRLFPLWNEFQPLEMLYGLYNEPFELSLRGRPLPDTPEGAAGIDPEMVGRMRQLLDLAAERDMRVTVGLVTGWMSGRMFVPPAFAGRNLLTDPEVLRWQEKLVRFLVRVFRDHPAVAGWGPGNECNAMSRCTREQAWLWLATITRTIREEDARHPVISGMHSLAAGDDPARREQPEWVIADQHELVDFYTTHPYPLFVPHAWRDGVGSFRSAWHAAAEGCFYSDLGGHPCICEEFGTLAPLVAGEALKERYVGRVMNNLWTHDGRAVLWWCAFDQDHLDYAPYEWNALERQLGLFTRDRRIKPFAGVFARRARRLAELAPEGLPPRRTDAVVLVGNHQDQWGNAWSAFLLAKQAGFDVRFAHASAPAPDSALYLLPGVRLDAAIDRRRWLALLEKVRAGATLYVSMDEAFLCPWLELFGLESAGYRERAEPARFSFDGAELEVASGRRIVFERRPPGEGPEVLAREQDGNPLFFRAACGRGWLYGLTVPLEKHLALGIDLFAQPYERIYRCFAAEVIAGRPLAGGGPGVQVTIHPGENGEVLAVAVNNTAETVNFLPRPAPGWRVVAPPEGEGAGIAAGDAAVFKLKRMDQ